MSVYTLADAILGSLNVKSVQNTSITANGDVINNTLSSGVLGERMGGRKDVRATFTTRDIGSVAAVANIATAGLIVDTGTITIPFTKRKSFSTFESGANHYAASATRGLIVPRSFSASDNGLATCSVEAILASTDGLAAPLTEAATASLASQAQSDVYSLGPISINGTLFDCAASANIDTGLSIEPFFCQGHNFAKDVFIRPPTLPMITVSGPSIGGFLGAMGNWLAGTSVVVYFRKRATIGFVADATAEHMSFSFADGLIDASVNGSSGDDASKEIVFNGENLVITTGVAIT